MSLFVRFDLSNLALDITDWNKTETDENTSCPMGDWTSQNWTKRDGRNNQEQQEQQEQQEKKATYKTAAELAVKNKKLLKMKTRRCLKSFPLEQTQLRRHIIHASSNAGKTI